MEFQTTLRIMAVVLLLAVSVPVVIGVGFGGFDSNLSETDAETFDILLRVNAEESHGAAPLNWDI